MKNMQIIFSSYSHLLTHLPTTLFIWPSFPTLLLEYCHFLGLILYFIGTSPSYPYWIATFHALSMEYSYSLGLILYDIVTSYNHYYWLALSSTPLMQIIVFISTHGQNLAFSLIFMFCFYWESPYYVNPMNEFPFSISYIGRSYLCWWWHLLATSF